MTTPASSSSALPRLSSPTVNCPDARSLAGFYADLTGGDVTFANDDWAVMSGPNGRIDFQTVPRFSPPTWPDGGSPVGIHLDFWVEDLPSAEGHAIACGAERFADQPNAEHCLVLRDPVGHPFCLTTWDDIGVEPS